MEKLRLFIAIELPPEVKAGIKKVQDSLKSGHQQTAKWVDPESIHLTLKFLGYVESEKVEKITRCTRIAAVENRAFSLEIKSAGAFPTLTRPQVVWIGLAGAIEQLQKLQKDLESRVSPLGFPPENRPFTPHLTLARVRDTATLIERQKLGEKVAQTGSLSGLIISVNSISLMRSQLTPRGAIYTRLAAIGLSTSC